MNELNEHKKDVHGVSISRTEKLPVISYAGAVQKNSSKADVATVDRVQSKLIPANGDESGTTKKITTVLNQNPCM